VPLNVKRQRLINRLDLERALVAAPLNPRAADILTLPAPGNRPTLHPAQARPASATARPIKPRKNMPQHKKHARTDISIWPAPRHLKTATTR